MKHLGCDRWAEPGYGGLHHFFHVFCLFGALSQVDGLNHVDLVKCMGCGVCVNHCEQDAIELIFAPEKGIPLEMKLILEPITRSD